MYYYLTNGGKCNLADVKQVLLNRALLKLAILMMRGGLHKSVKLVKS